MPSQERGWTIRGGEHDSLFAMQTSYAMSTEIQYKEALMNSIENMSKTAVLCFLALFSAGIAIADDAAFAPAQEPVYVVIMNHVEGDRTCPEGDALCLASVEYQTAKLPPPGMVAKPSYALDVAGNDLIYRILLNYSDSAGQKPKLFIEPTGEWWQTYAHPFYGGKAFDKYNYLALGNEFGIQGHAIMYSGINFGWYDSPHTEEGVERKFKDLDFFAAHARLGDRAVNNGKTFTGGWKIERQGLGDAYAEYVIDHVAFALGYRISFEDHDGHMKDEPTGINNLYASPFVYRAVYPDGVQMTKLDMNGSITGHCQGSTPRCETPEEAAERLDRTLQARAADPDPRKVYFFGFTTHSNGVWNDFNMAATGKPLEGEGRGLTAIMDVMQHRVANGAKVKFVTPMELAAIFEARNTAPSYFLAVHNEPVVRDLGVNYEALKRLVEKANDYHMKLTLMFTPPWTEFIKSDRTRAMELELSKKQGHEIAGHHHGVWHPGTWDGYTYLPPFEAMVIRDSMGKNEPYLGNLFDYQFVLAGLDPEVHSGCMNDEKDKNEMPPHIVFDTCSGYANFGAPNMPLPDFNPEKGRNDYASIGPVNGIVRKWLAHATVMNDDQAAGAAQMFAKMPWGVYGAVTHSVALQSDAMIKFMDFLHERDPLGEHSRTVSEILGAGLLPEKPINP